MIFDIETIPDIDAGRKIYHLQNLSAPEIATAMFAKQRAKNGSEFLPLHLHQIVAISVVFRYENKLWVGSLGTVDAKEDELIANFYKGIEKYLPILVSWNGCGFDLPVLHYRTLLYNITAAKYWEIGDKEQSFRWNNYINRYHYRHMDLMDLLSSYQARANAPLDQVATLLGFPGKMGMSGSKVWEQYQQGQLETIRNYCETDVLNTYLIYLKFEVMRGQISLTDYLEEVHLLRHYLVEQHKSHFDEFLSHWPK